MSPPVAVYSPGAGGPIQSHAWSGDRRSLAIAPGGSTAHVYTRDQAGAWREAGQLGQHELTITSLDWAPQSNNIVTCSQDRNAYVWVRGDNGVWR